MKNPTAKYWLIGCACGAAFVCLSALWPEAFWLGIVGFCLGMAWLNRPHRAITPQAWFVNGLVEFNRPHAYRPAVPIPESLKEQRAVPMPKASTFWADVAARLKSTQTPSQISARL